MHVTLHPKCICPACRHALNATTTASGPEDTPRHGDITLCIYCGAALLFFSIAPPLDKPLPPKLIDGFRTSDHADLRVRRLTREEWHALSIGHRQDLTSARRGLAFAHILMSDWRYQ